MKQTLPAILFVCICFTVQSQAIKKRDKLFGGSIYANYGSVSHQSTNNNVGLVPSFAWAIGTNRVLGIKGSISYSRSRNMGSQPAAKSTALGVGPGIFLKQYKSLKERFGIFFLNELSGSYLIQRQNNPGTDSYKTHTWGLTYNFAPGVFYKFSDHFLGEAAIGGLYAGYSRGPAYRSFNAGASFLQSFNLGINYIINHRRSS
jgi:hypothetical protein